MTHSSRSWSIQRKWSGDWQSTPFVQNSWSNNEPAGNGVVVTKFTTWRQTPTQTFQWSSSNPQDENEQFNRQAIWSQKSSSAGRFVDNNNNNDDDDDDRRGSSRWTENNARNEINQFNRQNSWQRQSSQGSQWGNDNEQNDDDVRNQNVDGRSRFGGEGDFNGNNAFVGSTGELGGKKIKKTFSRTETRVVEKERKHPPVLPQIDR